MRFACVCALLVVTSAAVSTARAQPSGASGWAEVLRPEAQQGRRYTRLGLALLVEAIGPLDANLGDDPRWLQLERALRRFEHARRLIPDDPTLAYYTAYALTRWERRTSSGGTEYRVDDAVAAWHRLRALAPGFLPDRVSYELAMLHMRRHEFEAARAEYETSLAHAVPLPVELFDRFYSPASVERRLGFLFGPLDRANLHGNLAEVRMLTGDVRGAVEQYRAAMAGTDSPFTRSLSQWGLALALDRGGDHGGALEWADRAIREDPIPPDHPQFVDVRRRHAEFAILHLEEVFFEPRYEVHAYEALGHEALATRANDPLPQHLASALRSWRLFLAEGGMASRFAPQARAHVARLEALQARQTEPDTARSRPRRRAR